MLKSLAKVGSNTMLSRVLGFIRDLVFAHMFGASAGTDAFFVAFKIPNFLRRLFAEGAFSVAFVPVLTEYKEKRGFDELKLFIDHVAGTLGAVLLAVTLLGVIGAPFLVLVFAPGFIGDPEKLALASDMLRLTFPYLFFISLTALAGGILNAHNRFGIPAFTPVLLNISMIGCALWLSPLMDRPVVALAWGVLFAGIAQLLFQGPFLHQLKLLPKFKFAPKDEGVRKIGRLMLPALFGVSVTQLNLLLDTLIASFLVTGSISWLYYSDRLMEFPLGVLGVALGTVILPSLSRTHATESTEGFSRTIDWALRWALLLGVPAAVGLFMLSGPMICHTVSVGRISGERCRHGSAKPDGLFAGACVVHSDQGAGAGLLRAPGYAHTGAHCGHCHGCQYGFEYRAGIPARACRSCTGHHAFCFAQCVSSFSRTEARWSLCASIGLAVCCCCRELPRAPCWRWCSIGEPGRYRSGPLRQPWIRSGGCLVL